jgi:hypothetical protein
MTDEQRAEASNGIWLCSDHATLIDSDEARFPVDLLERWKRHHEDWVEAGCPSQRATREITVIGGGIGSRITSKGPGTALEVIAAPGQTAESIHVRGRGTGEIITSTGSGTAKIIRSSGARAASESRVTVDQPVRMAAGLISKVAFVVCPACQHQFSATKVVHGFAGDQEPPGQVNCPSCGAPVQV